MLDSRAVDNLRLRFTNPPRPDLELPPGLHGIGPGDDGALAPVSDPERVIAQLCVDRRGVWLRLEPKARAVHVNGRPVRRMAMLRVGDSIYIDGAELLLLGLGGPNAGWRSPAAGEGDPRVLLRGVGGRYHGRSFTLDKPRVAGRGEDCDIRVDDPAFAERHARIELIDGRVVLRTIAEGETTVVNGEAVREAALSPGDQIVFDAHQRFVVEAPGRASSAVDAPPPSEGDDALSAAEFESEGLRARRRWRLPWLLLAALLLAAALSGLLLLGSPT